MAQNENSFNINSAYLEYSKKEKKGFIFFFISLCLLIIEYTIFLVFVTYKTRILFSALLSIISTILVFLMIYFFLNFIRNNYQKRNYYEKYLEITPVENEGVIISSFNQNTISKGIIVNEVRIKTKEKEKIFYIPLEINISSFNLNDKVKIISRDKLITNIEKIEEVNNEEK